MTKQFEPVEWVTAKEVAAALQLSSATVYRFVDDGTIPAFKAYKTIRIPAWWLEDTLDRYRKNQTIEETSQTALVDEGRRIMRAVAAAERVGAL